MTKKQLIKSKGLAGLSTHELENIIGESFKDVAIEYARRKRIEEVPKKEKITCSLDCYNILAPYFEGEKVENFYIILLNRANKVIKVEHISKCGVSCTIVDPKVIFHSALMNLASGMILAHNHPSENPKPSQADIELTKRIKEGGKLLEISVMDHIIYAGKEWFSFADDGMM